MRSSSRLATASRSWRSSSARSSTSTAERSASAGSKLQREQLHQLAGDDRVGGQGVLDVALAEGGAGLALVLGVGPQHRDLAAGQTGQQDEAVEAVASISPARARRRWPAARHASSESSAAPARGAQPEVVEPTMAAVGEPQLVDARR